jgi:redox-sensing transcriptional repressor
VGSLTDKISEFTIRRLSMYYRILIDLGQKSMPTVSSATLAELCGVTSAQVRKDLSYFGSFGTRGLGYRVDELKKAIESILGLDRKWRMALFGAGSLGHALFFHQGFQEDGFYFSHIFDVEPTKIGIRWEAVEVRPVSEARNILGADHTDIGVIATPARSAQEVADILVENEVKGILNFAPRRISVPETVRLRNVNLAVALENLTFFLSS